MDNFTFFFPKLIFKNNNQCDFYTTYFQSGMIFVPGEPYTFPTHFKQRWICKLYKETNDEKAIYPASQNVWDGYDTSIYQGSYLYEGTTNGGWIGNRKKGLKF